MLRFPPATGPVSRTSRLAPAVLVLALLGVGPRARAHLPHDAVSAVALPADLDPDGAWLVLSEAHVPLLHLRDARGFYDIIGGPPGGDDPYLAGQLGDGTVVLVGEAGLWWSTDLEAWEQARLPGDVEALAVHDGLLVLGGADGAWVGMPGDLARVFGGSVARLAGGERLALIDGEGDAWRLDDGGWTLLPAVDEPVSILATASQTWVGTRGGQVLRSDGLDWQACGGLPTEGVEHGDVVVLELDSADPDVMWVGVGLGAPFRSTDGCASFEDLRIDGPIVYGGDGSPGDETLGITAVRAHGDSVVVAGWNGLFTSEDGGGSWQEAFLLPLDYLRGLAVGEDETGRRVVYIGPYAAGPLRTDDEGASWSGRNADLIDENVQMLALDAFDPDHVYAVVGHEGAISRDGGRTWAPTEPAVIGQFDPDETVPGEVWGHGSGQVLRSTTGGVTWGPVDGLGATGRFVSHLRPAWGGECVLTSSPGELWCDRGSGWTLEATPGGTQVVAVVAGPALLAASTDVVRRYEDGEAEFSLGPLPTDRILSMAVSDDDTVFVGTQGGLVYRSQDAGVSWEELPVRLAGTTWTLAPTPGFAEAGEVLIATLDGSYLLSGAAGPAAGVRLERWSPLQRVDDASGFVERSECPEPVLGSGYDLDTHSTVIPGCRIRTTLRGAFIRVLGASDGDSAVVLFVDDEERLVLGDVVVASSGLLGEVEVGPGWHTVEVKGVRGEGLRLDGLESRDDEADIGGDGGAADGGSGDGGAGDGGAGDGGAADGGAADGGAGDGGAGGGGGDGCGCAAGGRTVGGLALVPLLGLLALGARRRA